MGVYIYTLQKKTVEATLFPENKKVTVALVKYFCKYNFDIEGTRFYKAGITRVEKLINSGFKPDFYTTNFKDGNIYLFKGYGFICDTPDLGKYSGVIKRINKKYYIFPFDEKKETFEEFYNRVKKIIPSF